MKTENEKKGFQVENMKNDTSATAYRNCKYLFGLCIKPHACHIERNLSAKGYTCPTEETFKTILPPRSHNGLPHIIKKPSL